MCKDKNVSVARMRHIKVRDLNEARYAEMITFWPHRDPNTAANAQQTRCNDNKLANPKMMNFSKAVQVAALSLAVLLAPSTFSLNSIPSAFAASIQSGTASWYGPGFSGRSTASGEIFNMHDLTAAHKTLPFGSRVKVTNLSNGKSVIVRINDRGPYVHGRVIDLSHAAASKIDLIAPGTAPVQMDVLS